jgi:hypothetical protein
MSKFSSLKQAEREWIATQLENAAQLVASFAPEDAGGPITLKSLDRTWEAWLATSPTEVEEINGVINCIGVQFGQILVDKAGFEWTIASDEAGTDLAVRALPNRADVLMYPANFVAKRWESRETGFLNAGFNAAVHAV